MAMKTKDFFETATPRQFEWVLNLYDQALRLKAENKSSKPENIIKLDKWYQNDLPKKIKSRGKDAHLTHDEMVQTIKWKLARGKFRPNLSNLVMMNTPRVCMQETKKAFRKLNKDDMTGAVQALCNLKGVGPAMASAVLAAGAPHLAPFMADECLWAMPDVDSLDYTMKEYMSYVEHVNACVKRINENDASNWTPHKVELAVWTYYIVHDLKPELLDELPSAKKSFSASDRVEDQATIDGAKNDTDDTTTNPPAAKSIAENSTDSSSSAASTVPPENPETQIEPEPDTVIPSTNGQGENKMSNNHNTAADNDGTALTSDAVEHNDAKVEVELDEGFNGKQIESDLKTENNVTEQNSTPIMTNGQDDKIADTSALSPSLKNDVHLSPANLTPQTTNGTSGTEAKINETSINRPLPDEPSVNVIPANGNSDNGTSEVPPNQETSAAAVTSNNVGEDWVMVEKEDCPATESTDNIPLASIKRLHETSEEENDPMAASGDAFPLQKKLRTEESTCDQDTIDAIKKQQQEPRAETATSPTKVDNGSSLVV